MSRFRFDKNSIGGFFLNHFEKLIFALGVFAVLALIYFGTKTKYYTKTDPEKLDSKTTSAIAYIERDDSWKEIEPFRLALTDTAEQIKNSPPLEPEKYQYNHLLSTRLRSQNPRFDPELKKPQDMLATLVTAPIVIKQRYTRMADFIATLDEDFASKKRFTKKKDKKDKTGPDDDEFKREEKKKDELTESEGPESLPNTLRVLKPLDPNVQGWNGSSTRPEYRECIAVNGLVPYEAQWREFDAKLRDAKGWFPLRDRPKYVYIEIQRRTDGGEWEDKTEKLKSFKSVYANYSSQIVPEFVDPKFLHPVLSQMVPPFLDTDYRSVSSHPKIQMKKFFDASKSAGVVKEKTSVADDSPFGTNKKSGTSGADKKSDTKKSASGKIPPRGDDDPTIEGGQAMGKLGPDSVPAGVQSTVDEFLQDSPSSKFKLIRFFDPTVLPGKSYEYRVRVWLADPNNPNPDVSKQLAQAGGAGGVTAPSAGGGGVTAPSAGGGGGPGAGVGGDYAMGDSKRDGGLGGNLGTKDKSNDLASIKRVPLRQSMLDVSVRERIRKKNNAGLPNPDLIYARVTEWSEPTPPVKVTEAPAKFYAGAAVHGGLGEIDGGKIKFYTREPSMSMIVGKIDRDLDVEMPASTRVYGGDLLNFISDVKFLHPLNWTIYEKKQTPVKSDSVVVGITGGERVQFSVGRKITSGAKVRTVYTKERVVYKTPGEVLIMDSDGNFVVRNELDDVLGYRQNAFMPDEELVGKVKPRETDEDETGTDGPGRGGGGR
jgi:hypothetical protein